MDEKTLDQEITEVAEKIEKSEENQALNSLKVLIKSMTREELQDKIEILNEGELTLFKALLEEIKAERIEKGKKAVEFDKENKIEYVKGNINDTVIQEDKADDDEDEKLVKPEAAEHKHQGDETPEGREGQKIEDKPKDKKIKKSDEDVVEEEVIEKGMEKKKMVAEEVKDEIEDRVEDHEDEMHEEKKEIEKKADKKEIKKSIEWEDSNNKLLKANILGRNHNFQVEAYIDEVIKAQKEEEFKKSETTEEETEINTVEDYIVKGLDTTESALQRDLEKGAYDEAVASKMTEFTSFTEAEMAKLCGVELEDASKKKV